MKTIKEVITTEDDKLVGLVRVTDRVYICTTKRLAVYSIKENFLLTLRLFEPNIRARIEGLSLVTVNDATNAFEVVKLTTGKPLFAGTLDTVDPLLVQRMTPYAHSPFDVKSIIDVMMTGGTFAGLITIPMIDDAGASYITHRTENKTITIVGWNVGRGIKITKIQFVGPKYVPKIKFSYVLPGHVSDYKKIEISIDPSMHTVGVRRQNSNTLVDLRSAEPVRTENEPRFASIISTTVVGNEFKSLDLSIVRENVVWTKKDGRQKWSGILASAFLDTENILQAQGQTLDDLTFVTAQTGSKACFLILRDPDFVKSKTQDDSDDEHENATGMTKRSNQEEEDDDNEDVREIRSKVGSDLEDDLAILERKYEHFLPPWGWITEQKIDDNRPIHPLDPQFEPQGMIERICCHAGANALGGSLSFHPKYHPIKLVKPEFKHTHPLSTLTEPLLHHKHWFDPITYPVDLRDMHVLPSGNLLVLLNDFQVHVVRQTGITPLEGMTAKFMGIEVTLNPAGELLIVGTLLGADGKYHTNVYVLQNNDTYAAKINRGSLVNTDLPLVTIFNMHVYYEDDSGETPVWKTAPLPYLETVFVVTDTTLAHLKNRDENTETLHRTIKQFVQTGDADFKPIDITQRRWSCVVVESEVVTVIDNFSPGQQWQLQAPELINAAVANYPRTTHSDLFLQDVEYALQQAFVPVLWGYTKDKHIVCLSPGQAHPWSFRMVGPNKMGPILEFSPDSVESSVQSDEATLLDDEDDAMKTSVVPGLAEAIQYARNALDNADWVVYTSAAAIGLFRQNSRVFKITGGLLTVVVLVPIAHNLATGDQIFSELLSGLGRIHSFNLERDRAFAAASGAEALHQLWRWREAGVLYDPDNDNEQLFGTLDVNLRPILFGENDREILKLILFPTAPVEDDQMVLAFRRMLYNPFDVCKKTCRLYVTTNDADNVFVKAWRSEWLMDALLQTIKDEQFLNAWRLVLLSFKYDTTNEAIQRCKNELRRENAFDRVFLSLVERLEQNSAFGVERTTLSAVLDTMIQAGNSVRLNTGGPADLKASLLGKIIVVESVCTALTQIAGN